LNRKILNLAIPNIISNITIPLLGIVDLAIMGHLESEIYIGAIALGGMIFNFIYWGFSFLRMGTSGFTAQAYGARDKNETITILSRAMLVALFGSILIILLQSPISFLSFSMINGSPEIEQLAAEYFHIRIWAAPATLGLYALTGWFLGMQNARIPMVIAIVINLLNLIFNLVFVYGLGMRADGVALGTVISQYIGLIMALIFFFKYYKKLAVFWSYTDLMVWEPIKRFFMVNKDIFIRTLCLIFTFSFFTARSASENDTILAVNTLLLQFLLFFSYLIDGFAYAAEALVGKYVGAKEPENLKKAIRSLFKWGLVVSIPFTMIYAIGGDYILYLLTDNEKLILLSHEYMFWIILVPVITFPAFIWDGVYIGATAAVEMRNALLVATIFIFIPAYFIATPILGNHGLWLALMLFMVSRGILLTMYSKRIIRLN